MSREEEINLSDRNINLRDSGIAVSFSHDNTINESSLREDKAELYPNLQVIPEEVKPDSYSNSSKSESNSKIGINESVQMAEEQPVTPSQLSALPTFDAEWGEGFVNWLEQLEVAQVTYNWSVNS